MPGSATSVEESFLISSFSTPPCQVNQKCVLSYPRIVLCVEGLPSQEHADKFNGEVSSFTVIVCFCSNAIFIKELEYVISLPSTHVWLC